MQLQNREAHLSAMHSKLSDYESTIEQLNSLVQQLEQERDTRQQIRTVDDNEKHLLGEEIERLHFILEDK